MLIHEQITLPDGVEVDAGIADLLTALWELGLRTSYSCQGTSERVEEEPETCAAYIQFPQAPDALAFLAQTLESISTPQSLAKIIVSVRLLTKIGEPGWKTRRHGPAVSLELSVASGAADRDLRGCVRFDPRLMPQIEAGVAANKLKSTGPFASRDSLSDPPA